MKHRSCTTEPTKMHSPLASVEVTNPQRSSLPALFLGLVLALSSQCMRVQTFDDYIIK
jgi:hypothetical protein